MHSGQRSVFSGKNLFMPFHSIPSVRVILYIKFAVLTCMVTQHGSGATIHYLVAKHLLIVYVSVTNLISEQ